MTEGNAALGLQVRLPSAAATRHDCLGAAPQCTGLKDIAPPPALRATSPAGEGHLPSVCLINLGRRSLRSLCPRMDTYGLSARFITCKPPPSLQPSIPPAFTSNAKDCFLFPQTAIIFLVLPKYGVKANADRRSFGNLYRVQRYRSFKTEAAGSRYFEDLPWHLSL